MIAWLAMGTWMSAGCTGRPQAPGSEDHAEGHDEGHDEDHAEGHDEDHASNTVVLRPEALAAARIRVEAATEGSLAARITLPARIGLDPRKEAMVSAWIAGQIDAIDVRTGDQVRRGQRLARVQSPDLGEAVAAFRTAKARDEAADARLERLKRLEADGVTSRAQVLQAEADHTEAEGSLEAAEERLRVLKMSLEVGDPHAGEHFPSQVPVRSPIDGTVLTTHASVGERVEPGQTLFHVGDLDEVWLLLNLYERDLAAVQPEQQVRFSVEAWPEVGFEGRVAQVGDWIEPESRTVEVRVVVANPEHKLKPNMFAQATLEVGQRSVATGVVLPAAAVVQRDGVEVVFVEEQLGSFEVRPVVIAERTSAQVLLDAGLQPGERVVVDGAFVLKSELDKGALGEGHAH
ncbi:MAG TPA: efflux RND transporter periplasmic adaptor subunit [Deltaproteobacteria bacterium]|nr:efflux RND transporter periplasmic adaptor subunit [Deltaproteobacteria bacterium]